MLTVTQLSDTHFAMPGMRSHGGFGYDTDEAFAAVFAHAFESGPPPDLVVVTGDVADHGHPDEYERAAAALRRLPVAANLCPGNHDFDIALRVGVPGIGLSMNRTMRLGEWLFVFADSTFDGKELGGDGLIVDRADRIESTGALGAAEIASLRALIDGSTAPHVFVWLHHPPSMTGTFAKAAYDAEVMSLIADNPRIRGVAGGHVHSDMVSELADRPVFVCPALTVNFDFTNWTLLPPGYRTYEFASDGIVRSECHLMDDPRWPRARLPKSVVRFLQGEGTWNELMASMSTGPAR